MLSLKMKAQVDSITKNALFLTLVISFLTGFLVARINAEISPPPTASNGVTHCTGFHAWLASGFSKEDCLEALDRFAYSDYAVYTTKRLEFSDRDTPSTSRLPKITTPRRYPISTCTIIVAMLWSFPNKPPMPPLPGQGAPFGPFEKSEVTSFQVIYDSVKRIVIGCYGHPETPVGWEPVGKDSGLGVFVMATESLLARAIPVAGYEQAEMPYLLNLTHPHQNSTIDTA